jgi:hypothetical protein
MSVIDVESKEGFVAAGERSEPDDNTAAKAAILLVRRAGRSVRRGVGKAASWTNKNKIGIGSVAVVTALFLASWFLQVTILGLLLGAISAPTWLQAGFVGVVTVMTIRGLLSMLRATWQSWEGLRTIRSMPTPW